MPLIFFSQPSRFFFSSVFKKYQNSANKLSTDAQRQHVIKLVRVLYSNCEIARSQSIVASKERHIRQTQNTYPLNSSNARTYFMKRVEFKFKHAFKATNQKKHNINAHIEATSCRLNKKHQIKPNENQTRAAKSSNGMLFCNQ